MKTRKISLTFMLLFAVLGLSAQTNNVNNVEYILRSGEPNVNLEELKSQIDEAAEHPKTMNSAKMHYWRGMVYLMLAGDTSLISKYPNALDVARESFLNCKKTDDSKGGKWAEQTDERLAQVAIEYYRLGYNAYARGDYDRCIYLLNQSMSIMDPEQPLIKENNLNENVLLELIGYAAVGKEDDVLAKSTFEKMIANGYKDENVYAGLVQLYLIDTDTTKALDLIKEAKEYFPFNRTIINLELDIYLKQGRSAELVKKLNAAILEDPDNTVYYFARAISYESLAGNVQKELNHIYNVKTGSFENVVRDSLGDPLSVKEDSEGKKLQFKHGTVVISNKTGRVRRVEVNRASLDEINKYLEMALADYDMIIEIDPAYYDAYYNKGALYQNRVSALVDEMNTSGGLYDPAVLAKYEAKRDSLYKLAIVNFEEVFYNNTEMTADEKASLARNMRRIYANLGETEKAEEMKAYADNPE